MACTRRGSEQSRRRRAGAGVGVLLTDGVSRVPPPCTGANSELRAALELLAQVDGQWQCKSKK
jgi:hypothetical protein